MIWASELLVDLGVFFALLALGWLLAQLMIADIHPLEALGLAFPLGGGLFTFALFIASWAGMPLTLWSAGIVFLLFFAALVIYLTSTRRSFWGIWGLHRAPGSDPLIQGRRNLWFVIGALSIFVGLTAIAGFISVGRAHSNWDAAAMWILKGYGIAAEGTIFAGLSWGSHGLSYPLNIHLLVALIRMASGDHLPGSQLIFTLFQASAILGCFAYWLRRKVEPLLAGIGLVFLASIPVLHIHATIGFANLPMAAYIVLGSIWGMEGLFHRRPGAMLMGGFLLGLGAWTIVQGMFYTAAGILVLFGAARWFGGEKTKLGHIALPAFGITLIWVVFYLLYGASGSQAMGAKNALLAAWLHGNFDWVDIRLIFGYTRRYLFHIDTWGLLFWVGPVILLFNLRRLFSKQTPELAVVLSAFVASSLLTFGFFYLRAFTTTDLLSWLQRGFPRGFLTSCLLFSLAVVLAASQTYSSSLMVHGSTSGENAG